MILLKLIESYMINSNLVKNSTIHGIIRLKHYNEKPAKRNTGFNPCCSQFKKDNRQSEYINL